MFVRSDWAYSPLPLIQITPTAELYALYIYLRHATPFQEMYVFHTDCAYVANSCREKTRAQLTCGRAVNALLWSRIFRFAKETAFLLVHLIKVKAHLKLHSSQGQNTKLCIIGNGYADKEAKLGVEKHPGSARQRKAISSGSFHPLYALWRAH